MQALISSAQKNLYRNRSLFLKGIVISALLCTLFFSGIVQFRAAAENQPLQSRAEKAEDFDEFAAYLDTIRQMLKIPGMSAAIVQDQELVWAAGFGYADLENGVAATPETPYGLASVTKPVGAVVIMQLVEAGLVDLDAPVTQYGVNLVGEQVTVRHLLTHTSEGIPGTQHHYNGSRYAILGGVMEGASGQTFAQLLSENILLPLGMENTALNPFNSWGGASHYPLEDLKVGLGWGGNYRHYPVVYDHLAQSYQLDEAYNIIPGMYQTYHNTGAGLISSVSDLANFDIALDQGLLLGEAAKAEMFSPAVSTYPNRPDLNYGLGWYVQDFEGQRLLWHTGRWSPSTSALYLKVPEKDLTFIVLGNTDNLTVPFPSIGDGDVTKSILFLSFFRHFLFPGQHGSLLPIIDWNSDEASLVQQLNDVQDEAAREFLERELWSFRQVYASTGQVEQAEKLGRVSFRVYPRSNFRRDWMFTQTAGWNPVIPPVTPASTFIWLNRGTVLWLILVFLSGIWMAVRLLHPKDSSLWGKFLWMLAALILGPVAVLIQVWLSTQPTEMRHTRWQEAWGSAALAVSGYAAAWSVGLVLLMGLGEDVHPLTILSLMYLLPLLAGLIFVRIPLLMGQMGSLSRRMFTRALLAEVISFNLVFAVFFPLSTLISQRLLTSMPHPISPLFLPMISFIALVAVILLVPLQFVRLRRGYTLPSDLAAAENSQAWLPDLRTDWSTLLATSIVMVTALAITIGQLG